MGMKFKAACVQAAPVYMNLEASVRKGVAIIEEAASNGARLVAFPETWLPGFPWFIFLGAPVWGLQFVPRYHANSMALDSEEMRALQDAAKANNIFVLMGFSERCAGTRYMAQVLIDDDGEIRYTRRKAEADARGTFHIRGGRRLRLPGRRHRVREHRLSQLLGARSATFKDGDVLPERGDTRSVLAQLLPLPGHRLRIGP